MKVITATGLAVTLLFVGCGSPPPEAETPRVLIVETAVVERLEQVVRETGFFGLVEARQSSELAFELAGTVNEITINEGDRVEAGDRLAELDHARLKSRINAAEAAVSEAGAGLDLAEVTFKRLDRLVLEDAASQQELDEARRTRDVAQATVDRLQAEVEALRVDLGVSTLYAPYDGVVTQRYVDEGASIGPARAILQMIESDQLEARIGLSSAAARSVSVGQLVSLTSPDRPEQIFEGEVVRIIPQRDARVRTTDVIIALPEVFQSLQPGDPVEVLIERTEATAGFWVPRNALTESVRGLWAIYAIESNKSGEPIVTRRPVEVIYFETDRAYVDGPLREGDRIVTSGLQRLVPGQRVQLETGA